MDKYTRSAQGQECTVRIPTICNFNPETTVFAHINGAGMGRKHLSIHGAYACSACHDEVDRRTQEIELAMAHLYHLEGMVRTQILMVEAGLLDV